MNLLWQTVLAFVLSVILLVASLFPILYISGSAHRGYAFILVVLGGVTAAPAARKLTDRWNFSIFTRAVLYIMVLIVFYVVTSQLWLAAESYTRIQAVQEEVPIYPSATVQSIHFKPTYGDNPRHVTIEFHLNETPDSSAEIFAFYGEELKRKGWEYDIRLTNQGVVRNYRREKGEWLTVTIRDLSNSKFNISGNIQ